jgi:hypothetical protein
MVDFKFYKHIKIGCTKANIDATKRDAPNN